MKENEEIAVFWFRRDLRLHDNAGLYAAADGEYKILPLFIFDENILDELPADDARVNFIYDSLSKMQQTLKEGNAGFCIRKGKPLEVLKELAKQYKIAAIHTNRDYEPYARKRDKSVAKWAKSEDIVFNRYKDQVIFEPQEVLKDDGDPYVVYTPFKNKWLEHFNPNEHQPYPEVGVEAFAASSEEFPSMDQLGFKESEIKVPEYDLDVVPNYKDTRNFPAKDGTSRLGPHLRFGTVGIRKLVQKVKDEEGTFLSELIWREFFMQILYHFPKVVNNNFREKYDAVPWRNNKEDFKKWCEGNTGYPMVDAGMRELNNTGYMHNRVRMITAGFLCKHLLIDWRWGEAYFAEKLLDYELASNNGNWQWAAGTGCDAAPYFRVFNPTTQIDKFDKQREYLDTWVPEYQSDDYPEPMVEHKMARERAISTYKEALNS
ncbi:cryptochrome/photolyase family protein [Gilvibacter sediminis]|uniref:cryptochrome/photolyase family protein n=1 Tax=Gilvibacter sediminis TaxID=379071 RepID=UPI0023508070|nr:deoxyribodipyrimidine photo-lyase [Gilvibacter sediminis]MDC7999075.1 deoxyribodipyrimidine photo-lyase [Gilvibacter sediminis]